MNFTQLITDRYSVRNFSDKAVEDEKLMKILEAGRLAPTAVNYQPQKIYVLKSQEALDKVRKATRMAFNAPVVLIVAYDTTVSWKNKREPGYDSGEMDASIIATHMMLQAQELGLGTLWARGYKTEDIVNAFNIPSHIKPVMLLDLGYPAEESKPAHLHYERKDLKDTVTFL